MLGEKIRKKVGDLNIKYNGNTNSDNVTISIGGVYTSLSPSKSIHQLIDAADSQLYHAKNEGRNKVCVISLGI
ncbi:diguanylate cyclase (GGDEF)-like protein [Brassicibacter mesophilus]